MRTRVGYTGGTKENPTYHALGDHSETVQLDYDPAVVTYEELLAAFFAGHDATRRVGSRQYMSAIFYQDAEQERLAREAVAALEKRLGKTVYTEILPASIFYMAEDYHQKYGLQGNRSVMDEYRRMYPEFWDIVDSTSATRANAYLYGYGTLEQLRRELDGLGLSKEAGDRLLSNLD
ncbi:MAG: peptide-methionine (S)-S-oxide reductase [Thermoleophilia bacterium]|nr:peptide-methionine (S)-S-oxide reductase [Thermoleophilia bacterium]